MSLSLARKRIGEARHSLSASSMPAMDEECLSAVLDALDALADELARLDQAEKDY